jgi:GTP-binding protein
MRKGDMTIMQPKGDLIHLEFHIPSRAIIGLRTALLNVSGGEAVMTHRFKAYEPIKGEPQRRLAGTMISMDTGTTIPYAIDKLQDRGTFYVDPGVEIYEGQILGSHIRENDIVVNVTKTKKLTNMRASGTDEKMHIAPAVKFSLEEAMEYIQEDEYVEITPKSIRLRKILLTESDRARNKNKALAGTSVGA